MLDLEFVSAIQLLPDYVVVHQPVWGPKWTAPKFVQGYQLAANFTFGELALFVYQRVDLCHH